MEVMTSCLKAIACAAYLTSCNPTGAKSAIDPDVAALISRTRETQDTYAVYMWNDVTPKGKVPFAEWSAEFHSGNLHRVENPTIRMVADCKAKTGVFTNIETGERFSGPSVARMACGIQANAEILSARKLGIKNTAFGEAIVIEIVDESERRTYDILEGGILLGQTISEKGDGGHRWVFNQATHVSRKLPDGDIFLEESLGRSVVSGEFRKRPVTKDKVD